MIRSVHWTRILLAASPVFAAAILTMPAATVAAPVGTITLDKTVMIDNGNDECGTETALTVAAGTTVRYCYTVTNTGFTPADNHTLVDDQLGTILSDFVAAIDPGQSLSVTAIDVIRETVTNTATWTADDIEFQVPVEATDSLTVTATPPSITLDKTVMIDNGNDECGTDTALTVGVGTEVRYCYTVTNTSQTPLDVHSLVDDQLGTILSDFATVLAPDASLSITQTALITATVTNTATWTAGSNALELFGITATDSLTVTATPPSITLDKTVMIDNGNDECGTDTALTVGVGTEVRYCYTVTNTSQTPLDVHSLVDDQLGTILSDFATVLAPAASVSVTATDAVDATVTNTATWTARNIELELAVDATDSLTVTVVEPTTTTTTTTIPATTTTTTTTTTIPTTTTTFGGVLPPTGSSAAASGSALIGAIALAAGAVALLGTRRRRGG